MKTKNQLILILLSILFMSCEKQPNCSDSEVKLTALELAEELIVKELASEDFINQNFRVKPNANIILYADNIGENAFRNELSEGIENEYKNGTEEKTVYTESIQKAITQYKDLQANLNNVRISSKDDVLRKCSCDATLEFNNGKSFEVFYTVQLNDNEETFVELSINEL